MKAYHRTRSLATSCILLAASLTGCVHKRLATSDDFAPISLYDGQSVARIAEIKGYPEAIDIEYRWRTKSGQILESEAITSEILSFLGTPDLETEPTRHPASEASWYWSPDVSQTRVAGGESTEPLVPTRSNTVIILGLRPTVAILLERPTEHTGTRATFPWHSTDWWGWSRVILAGGIADGRLVPTPKCPTSDFAFSELVIPSLGLRTPIDLHESGSYDWGSGRTSWSCVTLPDGRSGILFELESDPDHASVAAN